MIEALPELRLIIRYGVGLDTLDIPAATEHGVVVAHYPDFCQPEVANHAIMLLLAVAKKLVVHDRAIRAGRWGSVDRSARSGDPRPDARPDLLRRDRPRGRRACAGPRHDRDGL